MNKTIITMIISLTMILSLQAQDITNKLGGNTSNETYDITDSNDNLLFQVTGQGRVGIGTTAYDELFHVGGNSIFWGSLDIRNTGGTTLFKVLSNGKVGVGTANPDELFDVNGNMRLDGTFEDKDGDAGTSGQILSSTATGTDWIASASGADNLGNHTATQNLNLSGNWLSGDGGSEGISVNSSGDVGVGTASPTARLHVSGDDGLLVQGTYTNGVAKNIGAGTRLHFYPKRAAFRAGYVTGTQWDDANIGNISTSMGYNTTASNSYSTAIGNSTTASGLVSTAMGESTKAESYISMAMGRFNVGGGTSGSWVSTDPLFEIGIGVSNGAKANAVTVLKNGNVGIGTVTPGAKLSIVGLLEYADNAAALVGGLIAGDLYRTGDLLKIVH